MATVSGCGGDGQGPAHSSESDIINYLLGDTLHEVRRGLDEVRRYITLSLETNCMREARRQTGTTPKKVVCQTVSVLSKSSHVSPSV